MKKQKFPPGVVVKCLTQSEEAHQLLQVGRQIKLILAERSIPRTFVYELDMSITQLYKYFKGGDMYLSTFLRILYGLDIHGAEFFKRLQTDAGSEMTFTSV